MYARPDRMWRTAVSGVGRAQLLELVFSHSIVLSSGFHPLSNGTVVFPPENSQRFESAFLLMMFPTPEVLLFMFSAEARCLWARGHHGTALSNRVCIQMSNFRSVVDLYVLVHLLFRVSALFRRNRELLASYNQLTAKNNSSC